MRPLLPLALLLLAGCAALEPAPEEGAPRMLALDGRWPFDAAHGRALLAEAGIGAQAGGVVFAEALAAGELADVAGVDAVAARALGVEAPPPGAALVTRAWAERAGVQEGAPLAMRSHASPTPYVATYFEMERTPTCERRESAKLCFLPLETPTEARLRLRVDPGARDAAFLPDLVELGAGGRPAWWNGTFVSPSGARTPFTAHAPREGALVPAELPGEMEYGEWIVGFTLETNGTVAPAGAAGIVRVREPGYLWFDDRLTEIADARAQARSVLANATPTGAETTIARVVETLPLGVDVMADIELARALAGTHDVTALLVDLTPREERALAAAAGPDGLTSALRARPLPVAEAQPEPGRAIVFAAPPDIDLGALAPVMGARSVSLAIAARAPLGEAFEANGTSIRDGLLLLAHLEGAAPFALPEGGRWTRLEDALENLSRSRTLALASDDIVDTPFATLRLDIGEGNTSRSVVAIGRVDGGPSRALWTSAALVAGAGRPVNPRLVVGVEEGADAEDVASRALAAWAEAGVVRAR